MKSLKSFLRKDLERTRERWQGALDVLRARPKIDESLYEALETQLLAADAGVAGDASRIESLRKAQRDKRLEDAASSRPSQVRPGGVVAAAGEGAPANPPSLS